MKSHRLISRIGLFLFCASFSSVAQTNLPPLSRADWGAPQVAVRFDAGKWVIEGKKQAVSIDATNLAIAINAESVEWSTFPSVLNDVIVKDHGKEFPLRLADAR